MARSTRETKQKRALREAFAQAGRPISPDEVLQLMQHAVPGVSLATVYRNIHKQVEAGMLVIVKLPGVSPRYEMAGKGHHHHFQCRTCDRIYELHGCNFDPKIKVPRGFQVTDHEIVLYGTCADCA